MGFSLVWFAVQGIDASEFLDRTGFEDTGEPDEYFEAEHSGGELPGGWYVVVSNDLGLLAPDKLRPWSDGGRLVATVVHEGSMNSLSTEWKDGRQVWSVSHDGNDGGDSLEIEGQLPEIFETLKQDAIAAQAEAAKEGGGVDFVFDIPLDLAEDITGFRHDALGFDEDIPLFNVLERTRIAEA